MGRRKIEIKAIKDDRNRSVTFLKRKGGLFKKAHELSVLCSVEVAVIIFGHNKKCHAYSSADINDTVAKFTYYGGAHEHKGPADFNGKGGGDDDDEEDGDDAGAEDQGQDSFMPQHMQNQAGISHMRQATSASPPINHGVPYPQPRGHTPQPQVGSRPNSRNDMIRRPSSNLGPSHQQHVSLPPQGQNGYAYLPHTMSQNIYDPRMQQGMPGGPQPPNPNPQFQYTQPPQPHAHMLQAQLSDQRRSSMPPAFPQQERLQPQQPPPQRRSQSPSQQQEQMPRYDGLQPEQPIPLPAKSRSIFTPIDDNRSFLAQHWSVPKAPKEEIKKEGDARSQSVDTGSVQRHNPPMPQALMVPPQPPQQIIPPPQRMPTNTSLSGEAAKRPRLKVQIPSEQSDDGNSATAGSSPRGSAAGTPANKNPDAGHGSGVVLPPPSPSASAILSAGASGPPNPFARPLPPSGNSNSQSYNNNNSANQNNANQNNQNNNIETPMSALPSRFAESLLPSPSSFYPDWGFARSAGGNDSANMLPSPLNFSNQTPVGGHGSSFGREPDGGGEKRKSPDGSDKKDGGDAKRVKS